MSAAPSVSGCGLADTERVRDGIRDALQHFVSHAEVKRRYSPAQVAELLTDAGYPVTERAVKSWVAGSQENRRTPEAPALLMLFQLLGKRFATKVLNVVGMGAYDLTPALAAPASVVATMAMVTHRFAEAGIDQVFSNAELGELEPVADAGISALEPFSSRRVR